MTDDTIRPGSEPSRESEPHDADDRAVDETANEVEQPDSADDAAQSSEGDDSPPAEDIAEPAIGEATGDDAEPAGADIPEEAAAEDAGESTTFDTESAVEDVTDTAEEPATEAIEEEIVELSVDVADADGGAEAPEASAESATAAAAAVGAAEDTAEATARDDVFLWHPDHKGKSFDEVRAALAQDIAADQRQHRLAMDGAEESEQDALASVVSLERKWGPYDFDWAEQEPEELADRILEFERERERRRELITWNDYRNANTRVEAAQAIGERPAELSTSAKGLSLLLVVLLIVVILLAVWAL